ncbi:MAG TPA: hypothetical protein VF189_02285 [Patescibacteria group bacterium]
MKDSPQFNLSKYLRLDGNAMQRASRLPNHVEKCDVRQELFTTAKVAQRHIVEFLQDAVGVDCRQLLKDFSQWESQPLTAPSTTSERVLSYFNTVIKGEDKPKNNEDRGGGVAIASSPMTEFAPTISYFNLFLKSLGIAGTVQDEKGKTIPGFDRQISKGFIDDFIKATIGKDPKEEKRFRAFLAGHLFDEIHRTLIYPPSPMVRDIDAWKNHEYFPEGLMPKEVERGLSEMYKVLKDLPFSASSTFQVESKELFGMNIYPRLLSYFSALGWREELKKRVTLPYMLSLRQISQSLFADLN